MAEVFRYGYSKIVETYFHTKDGFKMGGYRIDYDKDGNEIRRTENKWNIVADGDMPYVPFNYQLIEDSGDGG